jgi:hypothetical protein
MGSASPILRAEHVLVTFTGQVTVFTFRTIETLLLFTPLANMPASLAVGASAPCHSSQLLLLGRGKIEC